MRGRVVGCFVLHLPFLQTENLLVSAAVGLLGCLMARRLATRLVLLALWVGLSAYLVFDQVYYKVFFDHFRRTSTIEGLGPVNASQLGSSLGYELDLAFGLNMALVVLLQPAGVAAVLPLFACPPSCRRQREAWMLPRGPHCCSSRAFQASPQPQPQPAAPLVAGAGRGVDAPQPDRRARHQGNRLAADTQPVESVPAEHDPRLADVVRACQGGPRPSNVLLVVLESVGRGNCWTARVFPPSK